MARKQSYEFEIVVTHTFARTITVRAETEEQAEEIAEEQAHLLAADISVSATKDWNADENIEAQQR